MKHGLKITQRHYEIIMRQVLENLPHESGGFLGGTEDMITAIMPTYNLSYGESRTTFVITQEDIIRAHAFFEKHNLKYYGVYHSHPTGAPEPSIEDIRTKQKYHFIIGLNNPQDPIFNAFEIINNQAFAIPLKVVDNNGVSVLDLKTGQVKMSDLGFAEEAQRLVAMYEDIKHERIEYPKMAPPDPFDTNSGFSTLA